MSKFSLYDLEKHVFPFVGTGYSSGLSRPLVAVTALGIATDRQPLRTNGAQVGDHVLVTKGIALEGTAILAQDFEDVALRSGLTRQDLGKTRKLMSDVSVVQEALVLAEHGATSMHDVTRGGVLETLLEIALLSNVGISIDASRVPIPPIVSQFARAFQFDPLKMISSGTLAATVPPERMSHVTDSLREAGVLFADVGRVTDGVGVLLLRKDGNVHYRESHCEEDELARMWTLYPRDG